MLELRRELAWNDTTIPGGFHATEDKQLVRDAVFNIVQQHDFRIDTTILEKPKTQLHLRSSPDKFYKYAWFYHMKYVAPEIVSQSDEVLVIAASVSTKKKQATFRLAIEDVMQQVSPTNAIEIAVWPAAVDPCLQVVDYCAWAIQRKWEGGDNRSYELIKAKIGSEERVP